MFARTMGSARSEPRAWLCILQRLWGGTNVKTVIKIPRK